MFWAFRDFGVGMTSTANRLQLSVAVIAKSVEQGGMLKEERSYHLPLKCKCEERPALLVCSFGCPLKDRRDRLNAIEAYMRSRDLKVRKSVTMAQVAGTQGDEIRLKLVAWMGVVDPEEIGRGIVLSR